jgi:hypothetical protein
MARLLKPGHRRILARAGETDVRVAYDAADWVKTWPDGRPWLMVRDGPFRIPVTVELSESDGLIVGRVPAVLVEDPGLYQYQFVWTHDGEQTLSEICEVIIMGTTLNGGMRVTHGTPEWAEEIFTKADAVLEAEETASEKAEAAAESAEAAAGSAAGAAESEGNAFGSATAAAASALAAQEAADSVTPAAPAETLSYLGIDGGDDT